IEGLEGGRFALYSKMHHALIDGYTGMRLMEKSLSTDPGDREHHLFCDGRREGGGGGGGSAPPRPGLGELKELGRALLGVVRGERNDVVGPLQAPRSILNGPISRNRRLATQLLDLGRVKAVGKKVGGTLNDVVLALSAGSLRRFLAELGALPDRPLIAMVPVNIRPKDDPGGGNAVAGILAPPRTGPSASRPSARRRAPPRSSSAGCRGRRSWG